MFADVIVDITHTEVDKIFEYNTNDLPVQVGSRCLVPFGNKLTQGIIIALKNKSEYPPEKIKNINDIYIT